jgi:hypothetical protein
MAIPAARRLSGAIGHADRDASAPPERGVSRSPDLSAAHVGAWRSTATDRGSAVHVFLGDEKPAFPHASHRSQFDPARAATTDLITVLSGLALTLRFSTVNVR